MRAEIRREVREELGQLRAEISILRAAHKAKRLDPALPRRRA
jgi:hypothetical protein